MKKVLVIKALIINYQNSIRFLNLKIIFLKIISHKLLSKLERNKDVRQFHKDKDKILNKY